MSIPIAGTTPIDDPKHRYQMPPIQAKIEGRGNGIKTVLLNIIEVANSLHREPLEITKFFGCELGAQTNHSGDKYTMNGAQTPQQLQNSLTRYIEKFVLCPNCRLPETTYKIKNKTIFHQCFACGAKEPVDMTHKITTAILSIYEKKNKTKKKNKLETIATAEMKEENLSENDKPKKKKKSKSKESDEVESGSSEKEKKEKKKKKDKEKEKKEKKKKDKKKHKKHDADTHESENENEFKATSSVIDDLNVLDNGSNLIRQFMQAIPKPTNEEIIGELSHIQKLLALPIYSRIYLLSFAIFTDSMTYNCSQVEINTNLFQSIIDDNNETERHLIGSIELFCAKKFPQLKLKIPMLLKSFYDNDIIKEENIFDWYNEFERSVMFSPILLEDSDFIEIKNATRPMIDWLKESDDDSETDNDNDDEEEESDKNQSINNESINNESRSESCSKSDSESVNENQESTNNFEKETNEEWIDDI